MSFFLYIFADHTAYRDHKIKENPNGFLDRIDIIPTEKEHLSQPELVRLANTDCKEFVLKKAFLFSCLTGLRKSDVKALTWNGCPLDNGMLCARDAINANYFKRFPTKFVPKNLYCPC